MRGRVSLTQYLESQEDQNMKKLLNFTRTQERGRDGIFVLEWRRDGVFILEWRRDGGFIVVIEEI